jgi:hypothetical protein
MHDSHDLDLIASYADGSQDPAAERLLESCADCRSELALHRQMKELLASAPLVAMSAEERTAMRAGVHAGLDTPVVSLESRRRSGWEGRWLKVASAAAAVFVVIGVVSVTNLGNEVSSEFPEMAASDGETESADAFTAAEMTSETTAAATSEETTAAGEEAREDAAGGAPQILEAIPVGQLVDAGAITRSELDERIAATIDLLVATPDPEVLDVEWFNVNSEVPAPSCLTSEVDPVFGVINAIIDGEETQTFIVLDPTTSEYRADTFLVDGCELT